MKTIPLTQGKFALVDDADYDRINQFKWHAKRTRDSDLCYAKRTVYYRNKQNQLVQTTVCMHQFILNPPSGYFCDHIDGDGLNNQRHNLRIASPSQNVTNRIITRGKNHSKFKGVTKITTGKNKNTYWAAQIQSNKKHRHIGIFTYTPEGELSAARAYDEAAKKLHGKFAKLNFKD